MNQSEQDFIEALEDRRYVVIVRETNMFWEPPRIEYKVKTKKLTFREANEYIDFKNNGRILSPSADYYFIAHHKEQGNPEQSYALHLLDKWRPVL
jgi:hypothetical protein